MSYYSSKNNIIFEDAISDKYKQNGMTKQYLPSHIRGYIYPKNT